MPLPPWAIAAIPGAVGAAGGLLSSVLGNKQREVDYNRQKKDQLEFFDIRNKYNSPENQMNLLKEAGLNPNLAYGKGFTSAGAGPLTSPDLELGPYRNPGIEGLTAIGQSQDFTVKNAQSNNLRAQADKSDMETILTKIKTIGEGISNVSSQAEFDEWESIDVKAARQEKKSWEGYKAQKEANILRDKYEIGNIEKQIISKTRAELLKYRLKMPEAEYNLISERIGYLSQSRQLQQLYVEYYEMLKGLGVAGAIGKALLGFIIK